MQKIIMATACAVAALSVSACASEQHSEARATTTLSTPRFTDTPRASSANAEQEGRTALVYGDNQTAVKLLERAVAEHPNAVDEFNLAVAYVKTQRRNEAIEMYKRAQRDGTQVTIISDNPSATGPASFNVANESRLRIALLEASPGNGRDAPRLSADQAERSDAAANPLVSPPK